MKLSEYQQLTQRTNTNLGSPQVNAAHVTLGIVGETGEIKDTLINNKEEILKEVGDRLWYISELANIFNLQLSIIPIDPEWEDEDEYIYWIAENVKKYLAYNKPIDTYLLSEYLDKLVSFSDILLFHAGYTLEECLKANIEKLQKRYPEKFSALDAIERKDEL